METKQEPTQKPCSESADPAATPTETSDYQLSEAAFPMQRQNLPDTRHSITQKFNISGHEGYITIRLYEDGKPGEMFLKLAKEGSTLAGLADTIGILTSLCLQHGVPVDTLADKLSGTRSEPSGHTGNPVLPEASSLSDYIFRWLRLAKQAATPRKPTEHR